MFLDWEDGMTIVGGKPITDSEDEEIKSEEEGQESDGGDNRNSGDNR